MRKHRSNKARKYSKRLSLLMVLLGILSIVIAGFFGLMSIFQQAYQQEKFIRTSLYFLGSGAALIVLQMLFFQLPDYLHARKSETARRRREHFRKFSRPAPTKPADDEAGSVLIFTLVLLGVVGALAFHVVTVARSQQQEADAELQNGLLRLAAIDTARSAMQRLADDPEREADHPGKAWATTFETTDPAGVERMFRIVDAQRVFDLNNLAVTVTGRQLAPAEVLSRIMVQCGVFTPSRLTEALRDWVDRDDSGVFETPFYQRKNQPYAAANRILYGTDELFQVEGWEASLMERKPLRNRTSLLNADLVDQVAWLPVPRERVIPLNINTAQPAALLALLGVERESLVERIIARRSEDPFRSTALVAAAMGEDAYEPIAPYLDVKSNWFHIHAGAYAGGRSVRLYVLAHRDDQGRVEAASAFF